MTQLRPHRLWLIALVLGMAALFASEPLALRTRQTLTEQLNRIDAEQATLRQALLHLHEDAAAAEQLSHEINANDAQIYLAPVDRLNVAGQFEPLAQKSRLERFTYTLSPEQPFKAVPPNPDLDGVVMNALALEAEAPHDGEVYRFLSGLLTALPGRAQLQRLTLARLETSAASGLGAVNVKLTASIDWLANKSKTPEGL